MDISKKDLALPESLVDYELVDSGNGRKLERFGNHLISRPDSQAIWGVSSKELWRETYASFEAGKDGLKGDWKFSGGNSGKGDVKSWEIKFKEYKFKVKPTPFRHLGIFPEQAPHWELAEAKLKKAGGGKVLNLFGYTGAASIVCAKAGAKVTHVDASAPSMEWAKENQILNGLPKDSIRWICDDALKFVRREVKRGNKYEGIIVDPPKVGRGANGEVWKLEESILELMQICGELLSDNASFIILTVYATDISAVSIANLLNSVAGKNNLNLEYGELISKESSSRGFELVHAIYARLV